MKCKHCGEDIALDVIVSGFEYYIHVDRGMYSCDYDRNTYGEPSREEQPAPPFAPQMLKPSNYERYRAFLDEYKALCEKYNLEVNAETDEYCELESMRIETLHLAGNGMTVVNEELEPFVEAMKEERNEV